MSRIGLINKLKIRFGETPAASDTAATNIGGDIYDETTDATKLSDADGDTYIEVEESADDDHARIYTAGSERLTIDDNGNVGIGTSSPNAELAVVGSIYAESGKSNPFPSAGKGISMYFADLSDEANILCYDRDGSTYKGINFNALLFKFNISGSEKMRIDSSGNVGIGKSPGYQLELSTDSAGKPSTNTWTIVSDERVKKNIKPFNDGLEALLSLEPIKFEYNGKGGYNIEGQQIGFNATEEIKKNKAPYLFGTYKAKLNEKDEEETELLNYNGHALPFILLNSIKELKEIIDKQQKVIHNFEKRLKKLEEKDEK